MRVAACRALAGLGDPRSRPALLKLLEDRRESVREAAASVLATFPSPETVRGLDDLLARERRLAPRTAVILMTGHPALEGAVSAIQQGAVDYLQKPVDPTVLAARIHRAVRERQMCHPDDLNYQDLVDILSDLVAQTIERVDSLGRRQ